VTAVGIALGSCVGLLQSMVCKVSKERPTVIVSMGDDPVLGDFDTA